MSETTNATITRVSAYRPSPHVQPLHRAQDPI